MVIAAIMKGLAYLGFFLNAPFMKALLPFLFVLISASAVIAKQHIQPGDGKGAFATQKYRNLFKENGHSKKDIKLKIKNAFQQLFHGTKEQSIYFKAGENSNGPLAYILDVFNKDIRS